ncbi:alpha/beta hydrolase family protein [Spirochaeta isovalerica]|uniref:Platelet-activating factor acetylhydrolase n=1 Tax=Spirochaeta isovalerica TaxID=150 RepID=A0A841R9S3_9SPIO|nr:hypothetical protein [Spirochaeta isovalerica]MBB6480516.1 hypothetical protein [Spirochaeta isovalerica]
MILRIGLIILVVFIAAAVVLIIPLLRQPDFAEPTGSMKIGTHLFTVGGGDGESRIIPVRVFYPAADDADGEYLPAMDSRIAKAFAELYGFPSFGTDEAPSHSLIDVPAAEGSFPVVLFSHGGFSYSTQNLSTLEELVSHGYIVLAVSHIEEAVLSIMPDGSAVPLGDPSIIKKSMKTPKDEIRAYAGRLERLKGNESAEVKRKLYRELGDTFYRDLEGYLDTRIGDFNLLIGSLEQLRTENAFPGAQQMDLEKIGMFGHSLGGITTAYICSEENSPILGGIDLDAPVITFDDRNPVPAGPFAYFSSTETSLPGAGKIDMTGTNRYYVSESEQPVFTKTFIGAAHYNFSDFNFMPPIVKFTPMLGSVDPISMSKEMNRAVLDFFDYLLKDGGIQSSFSGE